MKPEPTSLENLRDIAGTTASALVAPSTGLVGCDGHSRHRCFRCRLSLLAGYGEPMLIVARHRTSFNGRQR